MRVFCTYFDRNYLLRGLALHHSLTHHCAEFQLWILCMDEVCYDILKQMNLARVRLISLAELEKEFPALLEAKQNRTVVEYYFTCTPALPLYVLGSDPAIDAVTYLDADLFFFSDLAPLYGEIGEHSIAIIAHRFPPELNEFLKHGIFNVGFLFFRGDRTGLACLHRWLDQCLEWCYDRVEDGRFADQKYLDDWPVQFENLVVLEHKGANLAPWNLSNYAITFRAGRVQVDGQPLIFFHFHDLKRVSNWLYEPNFARYKVNASRTVLNRIYKPYIRAISRITRQDARFGKLFLPQNARMPNHSSTSGPRPAPVLERAKGALMWGTEVLRRIRQRRYILFFGGPSMN